MSPFKSADFAAFARKSVTGRAPVIAALFLCTALGTVALAKIPALSSSASSPIAVSEAKDATVAVIPQVVGPTAAVVCEQQTWPYISPECAVDTAGANKKKLVRVIAPERAVEQIKVVAASAPAPTAQIAATFASLTAPAIVPSQNFAPAPAIRTVQEAPAARRVVEVKRPKTAAVRTASRTERPALRRDNVAQDDSYQVRRVSLEGRDIAAGLY